MMTWFACHNNIVSGGGQGEGGGEGGLGEGGGGLGEGGGGRGRRRAGRERQLLASIGSSSNVVTSTHENMRRVPPANWRPLRTCVSSFVNGG